MTEIQVIILLDCIIAINVFIQAIWLYLWLKDRKKNKTNQLLAELVDDNLEIKKSLEDIKYNTYNISKNTYKNH